MWFASWSRVNIYRSLSIGHSHRARSANRFLAKTANSARVRGILFDSNEHVFEQHSELISLEARKQFHHLLEGHPSVSEQFQAQLLTGNSQMKRNSAPFFTWPSPDKAVRLKAIDEPNGARM
jgi:hypothetical protein